MELMSQEHDPIAQLSSQFVHHVYRNCFSCVPDPYPNALAMQNARQDFPCVYLAYHTAYPIVQMIRRYDCVSLLYYENAQTEWYPRLP